jgi:OOP family OmpA-OmpF porin
VGIHHVITNSSRKSKPTISPRPERSNENDGDGVGNGKDQCPNSPVAQIVNKIGCLAKQDRSIDRDNDGVIDAKDKCLNTTNRRNVIDTNGCYVTVRKPVELSVLFHFDFDSYATKPEHTNDVKKIVNFAKKYSDTSIELSGHTDSVGSTSYNQAQSQARVAAVAKLVEMNTRIHKSKIPKKSFGESEPKRVNDNFANRRANRRVEGSVKTVTQTPKKK